MEWDVEGPFEWSHARLAGEEAMAAGFHHLVVLLLDEVGSGLCSRLPGYAARRNQQGLVDGWAGSLGVLQLQRRQVLGLGPVA